MKTNLWMIGPLLSVFGIYMQHRRKDVRTWMQQRRIDIIGNINLGTCDLCGSKMRRIKTMTGKRKGQEAAVCKHYPECSFVRWGK
ncbi:MAG: hypothetical protein FPO08_01100 [Geobacter sp.]|nr:MAG: hypothetical protein FPO08_01100 [Geobacter sp.]